MLYLNIIMLALCALTGIGTVIKSALLDDREEELDKREAALNEREREIDRREKRYWDGFWSEEAEQ